MTPGIEEALSVLAREVARAVVAELRAGDLEMIDQNASPLGRRRHIEAVRNRVNGGGAGGAIVGRRYLLSREALEQELAAQSTRKRPKRKPSPVADLMNRYNLKGAA